MLNANEMSVTDQLRGMAKALREAEDRRTGVEVDESQRGAVQRMLDVLGEGVMLVEKSLKEEEESLACLIQSLHPVRRKNEFGVVTDRVRTTDSDSQSDYGTLLYRINCLIDSVQGLEDKVDQHREAIQWITQNLTI